ncbi:MAG TPA: hypothetical protein VFC46_13365, partial [Humisphaera sp.]|nr:hypothetical protein [Humisphaera sp.]
WSLSLGGYISGCPLVTEDGALFLSEQGNAAMVSPDASIRWRRTLDARINGAPFATQTRAMIPTSEGLLVLNRGDGTTDHSIEGLPPGPVYGAVVYQGRLCLIHASMVTNYAIPPRTYVTFESFVEVLAPKPAEKPRR